MSDCHEIRMSYNTGYSLSCLSISIVAMFWSSYFPAPCGCLYIQILIGYPRLFESFFNVCIAHCSTNSFQLRYSAFWCSGSHIRQSPTVLTLRVKRTLVTPCMQKSLRASFPLRKPQVILCRRESIMVLRRMSSPSDHW